MIGITSILTEHVYDFNFKQDFPHEDTFELGLHYDENITAGDNTIIHVNFSNVGKNDYDLIFHDKLYELILDGHSLDSNDSNNDGNSEINFSPGSVGEEYSVAFNEAGIHEIKVVAEFQVRLPYDRLKSYLIEKKVEVTVK